MIATWEVIIIRRLLFADRRKQLGLTQQDFEKRMGWSGGWLSAIESGKLRLEDSQWDELETELTQIDTKQKHEEVIAA